MKKYIVPLLSLAVLWSVPAHADSRDDVLENVARCGRIADPRAWLNCYYGAAQPMRDQLSLPPAPQAQILAVPARGAAVTAVPIVSPLPPPAQAGLPQSLPPAAKAGPPQSPPPLPRPRGGLMAKLFGGQKIITNVRATDYKFDRNGIFVITLADGTVWQQVSDDNDQADWHGPASRLVVSIKTGALQSYSLQIADDYHIYKVVRVH